MEIKCHDTHEIVSILHYLAKHPMAHLVNII
jgi:hypothetical protein